MSNHLELWHRLSYQDALEDILCCCGSRAWAAGMVEARPYVSEANFLEFSDLLWLKLPSEDWQEAFRAHPRIGVVVPQSLKDQSNEWSRVEQQGATTSDHNILIALAQANNEYERQYGMTFIVCATGKSAGQMLQLLQSRLNRDLESETKEAAEQQRQITAIRLKRWLAQ